VNGEANGFSKILHIYIAQSNVQKHNVACIKDLKATVHPKLNILSLFTHPCCPMTFCKTKKEDILKNFSSSISIS